MLVKLGAGIAQLETGNFPGFKIFPDFLPSGTKEDLKIPENQSV